MAEVAATISSVTHTDGLATFVDKPLPIAANLSDAAFQRDYGPFEYLSLEEGMERTLEVYNGSLRREHA